MIFKMLMAPAESKHKRHCLKLRGMDQSCLLSFVIQILREEKKNLGKFNSLNP
uniref:Uncharacterized protein n=1 Tax=Manihot esculenta TaxID=3983 RepID=A0A2C9V0Z1_MANES